ncbi:MAG: anaphase promoting complex subunit cdc16 [Alyxoria varia]|nr:MAG: anaphase promoting complex subunit cdc16 [Alyxoria varia]
MEQFLRGWQDDAASKNQFETAIFIGDKLLALTNSDKDATRLAQIHFSTGNYSRAHRLLTTYDLVSRNTECKYLGALCLVKQALYEDALSILGDKTPTHLIQSTSSNSRPKLDRGDVHSHSRHPSSSKHANGALSRNDRPTQKRPDERHKQQASEETNTIKFEAGMCFLRGLCYAKQNAFDRAKDCYISAVRIDVQCFEAFDQLMKNALMSPEEEWRFLDSLNFDSITVGTGDPSDPSSSQQAAELTRMLYITRLSKYKNTSEFTTAVETLSTHYKLSANPDLLLSKAELLFTQCRFKEALSLTQAILEDDRFNFAALPVHLACMHELAHKNSLQLLAHELTDTHPAEPGTWLAVGVYYLTIGKIPAARRFFSKSSMMDPHFGPAWIGFAHTFAAEGEHDQAISAYSTAARLFQGTHLPQLFLGMQSLQNNNMQLAHEFLTVAYGLCDADPLLLNELGVVYYHEEMHEKAAAYFSESLNLAEALNADSRSTLPTRVNLGHALRKLNRLEGALKEFEKVLRAGGRDVAVFSAKGLCLLELGRAWEAVTVLHEGLSVSPSDAVGNELLGKALEECAAEGEGTGVGALGWGVGSAEGAGFGASGSAGGSGGGGGGGGNGFSGGDEAAAAAAKAEDVQAEEEEIEEMFEGLVQGKRREIRERERERERGRNGAPGASGRRGAGAGVGRSAAFGAGGTGARDKGKGKGKAPAESGGGGGVRMDFA